jgi:putative tryptophan/tyrosine transport system substrate-binding protein
VIARRAFVAGLGAAAAWPLAVRAQTSMPVIGYLHGQMADAFGFRLDYFRQGLKEEGFIEGRNVHIEYRWANNQLDLLPGLAADLVSRQVSVIVAPDGSTSPLVAKTVTSTIPIVFVMGADPIQLGFVDSLSHPGRNATGVTTILLDVGGKRLELLCQLVPQVKTIAYLVEPLSPARAEQADKMNEAARALRRRIIEASAGNENEIETVFASLVERGATALLINQGVTFTGLRHKIVELAARNRLPAIYPFREYVADGGLMSYGGADMEAHRWSGIYTGRILKGEKPGDLPVQQSTRFEFVINLKTATTLGLTVSPSLLALADEVIE